MQVSKFTEKYHLLQEASEMHLQGYENAGYIPCARKEATLKVIIKAQDGQKTHYLKK